MAPSLAGTLVPLVADLTVRNVAPSSTLPGGKTPAQYAVQGRFNYVPSFPAALIFLALFLILVLANLFLIFRHRAWFWWVMNLAVISKFLQWHQSHSALLHFMLTYR